MNALEVRLTEIGSRWVVEQSYDMPASVFQAIADRLPDGVKVMPLLPCSVKLRRDVTGGHVHASLTSWMGSERQVLTLWTCGGASSVRAAVVVEALHDLIGPDSVEHTELVVLSGRDLMETIVEIGGDE